MFLLPICYRLPEDLLEKMPSAANSPMAPRRRNSRISSLAQALQQQQIEQQMQQQQQQQQDPSQTATPAGKGGTPLSDKFRHQLSVASMVQRFERDTSLDRKTRDGEGGESKRQGGKGSGSKGSGSPENISSR